MVLARKLTWKARSGTKLKLLLPEVFALGIEASHRTLGLRHYPVQVMGGIALFDGRIAEMQTGEGKTLTAVLPVLLYAMVGRGVHVVTANDYLASRDAEEMGRVYAHLGLSTGCVVQQMSDPERIMQYECDITYGTASEMGFDFLRDRLKRGAEFSDAPRRKLFDAQHSDQSPVQRGHFFALIDEVDSILIDEARTPLIIGVEQENSDAMISLYRWCRDTSSRLITNKDYLFDERKRTVTLTDEGCRQISLIAKPVLLDCINTERIYQHIEKALTAQLAFERDRDYVVSDGEIVIVDEGTGRKMEGRKWQEGLHQSVESKERIDVTATTGAAAKITIQSLFRQYEHLAGMTGTAAQARKEFKRTYKLNVSVIPPNRPCVRQVRRARTFASQAAKFDAIVDSIHQEIADGRAVLVGTPSVEASQALSNRLHTEEIDHKVLNALFHDQEAGIVKHAGQCGRVTIATNMAGRGTDILLDEEVKQNGGLHVIATGMHTSKRIDRQLVGRAARQGDPGSYQFFLSIEDELLNVLTPMKLASLRKRALSESNNELNSGWLRKFERLQRSLEKQHIKARKQLLKFGKEQRQKFRAAGLDPFLEVAD